MAIVHAPLSGAPCSDPWRLPGRLAGLFLLLFILLSVATTGTLAGTTAAAPSQVDTGHVRAALLTSAPAVVPGGEIWVALRQQIIPHWHTYWRNPGDSGMATRIQWTLPDGVEVGDILWPTPNTFRLGPVTNYGYGDEVVLLAPLRLANTVPAGRSLRLVASVSWLVCQEECIPEDVELSLDIPVRPASSDTASANTHAHTPAPILRALARQPRPWPGLQARWSRDEEALILSLAGLPGEVLSTVNPARLWFFPLQWGKIQQSGSQAAVIKGATGQLDIRLPLGSAPPAEGEVLTGVLSFGTEAPPADSAASFPWSGLVVAAQAVPALPTGSAPGATDSIEVSSLGDLVLAISLAFLGGLVLNLMPCVFPVLSIKALSLLQKGPTGRGESGRQGLAYTLGVLASFGLLAAALMVLRAGGESLGWGFQYQSPVFVLLVAFLMFGVGLSLSGLFSVGSGFTGLGQGLVQSGAGGGDAPWHAYRGSFFTGVLAAVVATPCTAPFMGAAVGYALGRSNLELLVVLLALGLGLAFPYLLLCAWPPLQRRLPRPGPWMETLKEALAFPMYGAAIWLIWVLARQTGSEGVLVALSGLLGISFSLWLGAFQPVQGPGRRRLAQGCLAASVFVSAWILPGVVSGVVPGGAAGSPTPLTGGGSDSVAGEAQAYSPEALASLRAAGKPVLVNMTAAWCISCLVNERVALSDPAVTTALGQGGVHYLKGDWTRQDPAITAYLQQFGRRGVPLYVFYPSGRDAVPQVLPQLLTPARVLEAIQAPAATPAAIDAISDLPTHALAKEHP